MKKSFLAIFLMMALFVSAGLTLAEEKPKVEAAPPGAEEQVKPAPAAPAPAAPKIDTGDTAWMLVSAALVLLMTPALGLFYGGMVRTKNVLGTVMQSFIIIGLITVQWILWGYSLAFGPDVGGIIGNLSWFGLNGVGLDRTPITRRPSPTRPS